MAISVFLAQILGPCFLIIGLGMMLNRKFYQKMMEDYCKNAALIMFGGMFALFVGLIITLTHNIWIAGWPVIITIYGWGGIIKGIWLIVFPNTVSNFIHAFAKNKTFVAIHLGIVLALGAILSFFGYFA